MEEVTAFIDRLRADEIQAVFHYVPLHSSPFGRTAGRADGDLTVTDDVAARLVRLPLWLGLEDVQDHVIERILAAIEATAAIGGHA